jgi:arginine N-succinyltransferase
MIVRRRCVFLIRQSKPEDVPSLLKLAKTVYFINLPPNEAIIAGKIEQSAQTFRRLAGAGGVMGGAAARSNGVRRGKRRSDAHTYDTESDLYMLTIVDPEGGGVIGTSQVRAHMGGPGEPNWSFKITEKKFHSPKLGFGTTHTVGQLYGDETGPSEIGGLILDPGFRGHKLRPGRLLSFVRFHLIGLHPVQFSDRILAEMMAPVTSDGDNMFWDHFGRKFIPVKYAEADRFCQHNRAFISELLPKDEIYLTLFPLEVQNQIATVGRDTLPARRLLESLGFRYRNFIDPFDGGPHLDVLTNDVPLVNQTQSAMLGKAVAEDKCQAHGMVSVLSPEGEYRAVETACSASGDDVRLPVRALELLSAEPGMACGFTPLKPANDAPATVEGKVRPAKMSAKAGEKSNGKTPVSSTSPTSAKTKRKVKS